MDIKEITQHAKEQLLKHKECWPTFLVELEGKRIEMVVFDHLEDTTPGKMKQCFSAARGIALERKWRSSRVKEIIFIVEAWMAAYQSEEEMKYARVADDPKRKECLIVSKLAVVPPTKKHRKPGLTTTMQIVEMLRDGSGDLVDLLPDEEIHECHHELLQAFMGGIVSADFSDEQLSRMVAKL